MCCSTYAMCYTVIMMCVLCITVSRSSHHSVLLGWVILGLYAASRVEPVRVRGRRGVVQRGVGVDQAVIRQFYLHHLCHIIRYTCSTHALLIHIHTYPGKSLMIYNFNLISSIKSVHKLMR